MIQTPPEPSFLPSDAPVGAQPEAEAQFPTLVWEVWRAKENPRKTVLAVAVILLTLLIVALAYREPLMIVVALLVLGVALSPYFVPVTYTFDQNGITTDRRYFKYSRRWSEFRSFIRTTGGVVISPFSSWTYLDNFRGLHLLLPADPQPVMDYLRDRLPEKQRPKKK